MQAISRRKKGLEGLEDYLMELGGDGSRHGWIGLLKFKISRENVAIEGEAVLEIVEGDSCFDEKTASSDLKWFEMNAGRRERTAPHLYRYVLMFLLPL